MSKPKRKPLRTGILKHDLFRFRPPNPGYFGERSMEELVLYESSNVEVTEEVRDLFVTEFKNAFTCIPKGTVFECWKSQGEEIWSCGINYVCDQDNSWADKNLENIVDTKPL